MVTQENKKYDDKKDAQIARMVQKGQKELFGILIERYEDKLKRYGWKFLNTKENIEDITQDIFIKVFKNIQSYNYKKRFSPWIYRIAHNEFVNKIESKSRSSLRFFDPDTIFPHLVSEEEKSTDKYMKKELFEAMESCLDNLKPKYREPIYLYYFEDLSYEEISDIIKIPTATVGTRLKRAKKQLKDKCSNLQQFHE